MAAHPSKERLLAAAKTLFLARGYAELADTNGRMQQAVSALFRAVADHFAENLRPLAAQEGAGKQGSPAGEMAETLLGLLEGAIILAKAHRDPSRIPKAIGGFRRSLAARI